MQIRICSNQYRSEAALKWHMQLGKCKKILRFQQRRELQFTVKYFTDSKRRSGLNFFIKNIHKLYLQTNKIKHILISKVLEESSQQNFWGQQGGAYSQSSGHHVRAWIWLVAWEWVYKSMKANDYHWYANDMYAYVNTDLRFHKEV